MATLPIASTQHPDIWEFQVPWITDASAPFTTADCVVGNLVRTTWLVGIRDGVSKIRY
ncbi:hypothetical protein [Fimbriiglobus ruber]|uniref:Uncharacterized protein n=1 Tax=Fimbriiglobus ruber TaxID=1908690 RepID=A0A225D5R9_9BACT|nr:hypothetical protein [Fimbriiglobus ruber]OWK34984.1 hypothetical protein FRUB_09826 [Fimbriiglobus ruber]